MPRFTAVAASAALLAVLGLTACASGSPSDSAGSTDSAEMDHITIQLDYTPRGLHTAFYVADAEGYFAEQGIVVDAIIPGQGSGDTLRLVGQGMGDFGSADLPSLVVARSQGVEVTALNAINQNSPLAMCTVADAHPLNDPADLKGLSVGVQASGSTYIFYKALLAANGLQQSDLTESTVKPPYESYLLTGQVDTVPCYTDAEVPILEEKAVGPDALNVLLGSDYGYDAYGTGVFTSQKMIDEKPDLVQRFMNAYTKGFQHVLDDPAGAAATLAAASPEYADNAGLYEKQLAVDIAESFQSPDTEAAGLGAMTEEKWQDTIDILSAQGVIEEVPATSDVFDSTFVEASAE